VRYFDSKGFHPRWDDPNTPTVLAKEYFDALEAPRGKRWVGFKDAHMAMSEDRQQFLLDLKSTLGNTYDPSCFLDIPRGFRLWIMLYHRQTPYNCLVMELFVVSV
jgi:hypothetical protein